MKREELIELVTDVIKDPELEWSDKDVAINKIISAIDEYTLIRKEVSDNEV